MVGLTDLLILFARIGSSKKGQTREGLAFYIGSGGRIRTYDQRINSPLRYRCATPDQCVAGCIAERIGAAKAFL